MLDDKKRRRIVLIGISSFMLLATVASIVGLKSTTHNSSDENWSGGGHISTTSRAIQSACQATNYKQACEITLSQSKSSEPKDLVQTAFNAAMQKLEVTLKNSSTIHAARNDPRCAGALEVCKELMETAIGDLKRSIDEIGGFEISKIDDYVENMRIWLSGAITFQETCIDAFENTTGNAGKEMKEMLHDSLELTSNGLAMATGLSGLLKGFSKIPLIGGILGPQQGGGDDHDKKPHNKIPVLHHILPQGKEGEQAFPNWVNMRQRKLLETPASMVKADVVVAKDGSGKYTTITEALREVPLTKTSKIATAANKTFVIHIKEGVYEEEVRVEKKMMHVMFIGDGPTKTKVTGRKNFVDGVVTYKTATVAVFGSNFIAKDMGFENTAGPEKHQAVALMVQSDMSIFYNCQMDGYQDTLYTHSYRQFYRDCTISGTIDFLFGDAAAVFQNCKLVIRKPMENQKCIVTAQGRTDEKEATGLVLQNCTIVGDPLYYPQRAQNKAFLGRPWKKFARTVIMQSFIDDSIVPEGWEPWTGTFGLDTCFFAEFMNRGPGSVQAARVKWPGIKRIHNKEAIDFTPGRFFMGDNWIPLTGVPYVGGMLRV